MSDVATITATEFEVTCLELFDRIASGQIRRLTVTKRGKPVAVLTPPEPKAQPKRSAFEDLYGAGKGLIDWPEGFDFMQSPWDGMEIHSNEGFHMSQDYDQAMAQRRK